MKRQLTVLASLALGSLTHAAVIQFDLSPAGTDAAEGLSPLNEVVPATNSMASGDEISAGINFNTDSNTLTLAVGFGGLSAPLTGLHIHGPAGPGTNGPIITNLAPYLFTQGDPVFGGVIFGQIEFPSNEVDNLLAGLDYINIHSTNYPGGELRGQLIPILNHPPMLTCPEPSTVECGESTSLTAQVSDPDNDEVTVIWSVNGVALQTNVVAAGTSAGTADVSLSAQFLLGTNAVVVTATDSDGATDECNTTVTVVDTVPPVIVRAAATPATLWPPNHKMVEVTVRAVVTDECSETMWKIIDVIPSEPDNALGDGNTTNDWEITGLHTVKLRAERSGITGPRIYNIKIQAMDMAGNLSEIRNVIVTVPHDMRGKGKGR